MNQLCCVTFDMDGLMFNTEDVYWVVGSVLLRRRGHEFTRELSDAMMGRPPRAAFEVMIEWYSLPDTWETLSTESESIYLDELHNRLAPMPGLLELLGALEEANIPKGIATSSHPRLVEATLAAFDFRRRFQFVLTAGDIVHGKPDPEIYLKAADQFGIAPKQMMVLEDSQIGCQAAAAAEAFVVAVPGEHSKAHDFGVASLVAHTLADPAIYKSLGIEPPTNR